MVGNGNHPLNQSHVDEVTLEEYVLGQLLPDQEEVIRHHLDQCSYCRNRVVQYRAFCGDLAGELHRELDNADPGPRLSFDQIASGWRKPRRQFNLRYRVQQFIPSTSLVLVVSLLVVAFALVFQADDTAALRRLDLVDNYAGPPAMVAASTDAGVVVLRLDASGANVITSLGYADEVRNLRFSPDGQWVAFQEDRTLHVLECRDNGAHVRIDVSDWADWSWSPDSAMLAYTDGEGQLAVFESVTQASRVIAPSSESVWGKPVWSADGQQIAYAVVMPLPVSSSEPVWRQGIWRVDPVTGYRVELARNPSPDDTLLAPTAWANGTANVLAWDANVAALGGTPALYWIDTAAHHVEQVDGQSLAYGMQLSWPVSSQQVTLMTNRSQLYALNLSDGSRQPVLDHIPWPQMLDWAPNGAWMAYTVAGAAEGDGLYTFALDEHELHQVKLPAGATEKIVYWAGPEHLFVVRQPEGASHSELWLVSLTTNEAPQRIMTNVNLPETSLHNGWRWGDVIATQVLTSG